MIKPLRGHSGIFKEVSLSVGSHSQPGRVKHCRVDINMPQAPFYFCKLRSCALQISHEVKVKVIRTLSIFMAVPLVRAWYRAVSLKFRNLKGKGLGGSPGRGGLLGTQCACSTANKGGEDFPAKGLHQPPLNKCNRVLPLHLLRHAHHPHVVLSKPVFHVL